MTFNQTVADNWAKLTNSQKEQTYNKWKSNKDFLDSIGGWVPQAPTLPGTNTGGTNGGSNNNSGMGGNIGSGLGNVNTGGTNNNTQPNQSMFQYTAPGNKKLYTIESAGNGQYRFARQDGTIFTGDLLTVINTINEGNLPGSDTTYSSAQKNYNDRYNNTYGINPVDFGGSGAAGKLKQGKDETAEAFERRQKVADLEDKLGTSFNKLSFDNATFKKLVDENLKAQLLKNAQLQDTLYNQKAEADKEFSLVKGKFDEYQQEALDRINKMESEWMNNFNELQNQNKEYYKMQTEALNARVGGEQSGVADSLAAKGINEGVIGNAISQVKESHLGQYNKLLENNINIARNLNNDYQAFFQSIQTQRDKLSTEDIRLLEKKFDYAKTIIDASKDLSQGAINNAFKPYEDAITAMTEGTTDQMKYQAIDQAKIERYTNSNTEERKLMLMAMLGLDDATIQYGATSKFDIALLDKAAQQGNLSEAIRTLYKAAQLASTSGTNINSPVLAAAKKGVESSKGNSGDNTKQEEQPKVDEQKLDVNVNNNIGTEFGNSFNLDTANESKNNNVQPVVYTGINDFLNLGSFLGRTNAWADAISKMSLGEIKKLNSDVMSTAVSESARGPIRYLITKELKNRQLPNKSQPKNTSTYGPGNVASVPNK